MANQKLVQARRQVMLDLINDALRYNLTNCSVCPAAVNGKMTVGVVFPAGGDIPRQEFRVSIKDVTA